MNFTCNHLKGSRPTLSNLRRKNREWRRLVGLGELKRPKRKRELTRNERKEARRAVVKRRDRAA